LSFTAPAQHLIDELLVDVRQLLRRHRHVDDLAGRLHVERDVHALQPRDCIARELLGRDRCGRRQAPLHVDVRERRAQERAAALRVLADDDELDVALERLTQVARALDRLGVAEPQVPVVRRAGLQVVAHLHACLRHLDLLVALRTATRHGSGERERDENTGRELRESVEHRRQG
jgi:hypothetical protein